MGFTIRRIGEEPKGKKAWKRVLAVTAVVVGIARPAVQMLAAWRSIEKEEKEEAKRTHILKVVALSVLAVLAALIVIGIFLRILIALNIISAQSVLSITASPLPKDAYGQTNILLLGQGDENHDGVDLTDTIMLASIDPQTESAVLLSIPRDLYIYNVPSTPNGRINELFLNRKSALKRQGLSEEDASQQGMKEMAAILGDLMGVQIHHVAKIDFIGFVQAVDAIGGVMVDVPYTIVDAEFPADRGYGYQTFMITKGPHQLDGETALKYARSRHTTSDFGRSARQQQLLSALAQKMKEQGLLSSPGMLLDLLSIAGKHAQTTLSFGEIAGLAKAGRSLDRSRIITMQLNLSNGFYGGIPEAGGLLYTPPREQFGGASVLLPVSIPEFPVSWRQIESFTELLLRHRALYLPPLPVEIRNVSAAAGSAQRLAWELTRFGLNVVSAENAPDDMRDQELPSSKVFVPKTSEEAGELLSSLLGVSPNPVTTPLLPDIGTGSVLILLGKDYSYTPIQDLLPRLQQ